MLGPGRLVSDPVDAISLGLALMLGTAGLPHILMRFYTVPDARTARTSVGYATAFIGFFYLLTFILGLRRDGARRARRDHGGGRRRQHGGAAAGGGASAARPFFGFISAVAFATILAVVAGLTLSGAATLSHDLWVNVVRHGQAELARGAAWSRAARPWPWRVVAIALGILFKGQNVAYMVGLAFAIAASANFPVLVLSIFWSRLTTAGAQASTFVGHRVGARADLAVAGDPDRRAEDTRRRGSRCAIPASSPFRWRSRWRSSCRWLSPGARGGAAFHALERRIHLGAE